MSTRFDDALPSLSLSDLVLAIESEASGMLGASLELRDLMQHYADRGAEYARAFAPVGDRDHVYHGHVDSPGDYRDSIKGHAMFRDGRWVGIVQATDFKAWWIEFGTVHQAALAPLRRARGQLAGDLGGSFDDSNDVQANWSGWENEYQFAESGSWRL